jgi:hypothetical protein
MFVKLGEIFSKSTSDHNLDLRMEALCLVTPIIGNRIAQLSYELFHTIMASSVVGDKKWEAARLTTNGVYNWDKYLPWVEDLKDVLAFLEHHSNIRRMEKPGTSRSRTPCEPWPMRLERRPSRR